MISGVDVYRVLSAVLPLYVCIVLGYASVRWLNILNADQSAGINRYVALIAYPALSFQILSQTDLYRMNWAFLGADTVTKGVVLGSLVVWGWVFAPRTQSRLWVDAWVVTVFMVSTIPNTLIIGVPLLSAMYGPYAASLMAQIVVFQAAVWLPVLILMLGLRAAKEQSAAQMSRRGREGEAGSALSAGGEREGAEQGLAPDGADVEQGVGEEGRDSGVSGVKSAWDQDSTLSVSPLHTVCHSHTLHCHCVTEECDSYAPSTRLSLSQASEESQDSESGKSRIEDPSEADAAEQTQGQGDGVKHVVSVPDTAQPQCCHTLSLGTSEECVDTLRKGERRDLMLTTLKLVAFKLATNPNNYAAVLGVAYSLLAFGLGFDTPEILRNSIEIVAKTGLGMSMYSLGLFMASQKSLVPCGIWNATWTLSLRFVVVPLLMAAASYGLGIRGTVFQVAVVQAALPPAIVTFVLANEYQVNPGILSTGVSLGTMISFPVLITLYVLLGL